MGNVIEEARQALRLKTFKARCDKANCKDGLHYLEMELGFLSMANKPKELVEKVLKLNPELVEVISTKRKFNEEAALDMAFMIQDADHRSY